MADTVGGWVADEVLLSRCRLKLLHARKCMQAVAMLVPCGCFLLLCGSTSAGGAAALLAAAIAASSWSHAGYAANILDLAGGDAATAAQMWGVVNTIGTVPGIAANVVTGRVLAAAPTAAAGLGARLQHRSRDLCVRPHSLPRLGASAATPDQRGGEGWLVRRRPVMAIYW